MQHDDLWEHMALTRLQHMRGAITTQEKGTFRRAFVRALARRRDKPGISPMGTVRTEHDRPRHELVELNPAVWRAIDHGMRFADDRFGTPHVRPTPPAPVDLGSRHSVRVMVPHAAVRVPGEHDVQSFSTLAEAVLPEVPAADAPVVCRLPAPGGAWVDVRLHEGRHIRPLMAPGGWEPLGLADFARLAAGREPWVDNPAAPACPQHVSVLPLEVTCPPSPSKGGEVSAAAAEARARVGALGLCIVDGLVHVATEAPQLTRMATLEADVPKALATWRLGWLTGLTDMRTEVARHMSSSWAFPDAYLLVGRPSQVPFHDVRGWHRPLTPDDRDLLVGAVSSGGRRESVAAPPAVFPRPDLVPGADPLAHVMALDRVMVEVQGLYDAGAVNEPWARQPGFVRPGEIPAPQAFAWLRETVGTACREGQDPSPSALREMTDAIDGYLEATVNRRGPAGDRLGVLGDVLRPAFQAAREEATRLLERSPDPDLAGLSL